MIGIKVVIICYYAATGSVSELPADLVLQWVVLLISYPHLFSKAEESSNVYIGVDWELYIGVEWQTYCNLFMNCFHPEPEGEMLLTYI